ncbi:MAG: restriction endonuclease subunit [Candidatus Brocadiaceae bacterium]|nr:restriction endonuclease subunit [Candidatus Brocadiaceae bacterium]
MIDVSAEQLNIILNILKQHVPGYEVRAFGSRHKWTAKDYSDLDLAVVGETKLDWKIISNLKEAFEESDLPFRVDVLDWHAISPKFRDVITAGFEVIQKRLPVRDCTQTKELDMRGKGWRKVKLGELGKLARGKSKHRPRDASFLYGGAYPFIQTGDIKAANHKIIKHSQTYSEDGLKQSKLWDAETICITIAANIADTAILTYPACFPDSVIGFIANKNKCDVEFVEYLLQHYKKGIQSHAVGSVQDNINLGTFESIEFNLPDLPTQRRIASILSALDDKIELNRQTNQTLEAIAQAIFKEWFVDFRFPGSTGEMQDSELGLIPKGWRVGKLGEVCERITKGTTPTTMGDKFVEKGITFLRAECIQDEVGIDESKALFINEETHDKLKRSKLVENDILITIAGTIGRIGIVPKRIIPANTNQAIGIIRIDTAIIPTTYMYYFIKQPSVKEVLLSGITQSVQANISLTDLTNLRIKLPEVWVASSFDSIIFKIRDMMDTLTEQSATLTAIRNVLLPKLMNGEICVTEQQILTEVQSAY